MKSIWKDAIVLSLIGSKDRNDMTTFASSIMKNRNTHTHTRVHVDKNVVFTYAVLIEGEQGNFKV